MEGKERFTDLHYLDNQIFVYDNKLKSKRVIGIEECFELLNQQDARVKELEKIRDKGNQKLENFYNEKIDRLDSDYNKHFNELIEENQQLEQQLADKLSESEKKVKDLQLQLFAFVRNSCVAPVGLKLKKTQQEITDKTFETIREAQKIIDGGKMRAFMNLATNKEDRYDN